MTREELKDRVIKAEARVLKRTHVVSKLTNQIKRMTLGSLDVSMKQKELNEAKSQLNEANRILNDWKAKLDDRIKQDDFIEANTPDVISDFLNRWEKSAFDSCVNDFTRYMDMKSKLKEMLAEAKLEAIETLPSLESYRLLVSKGTITKDSVLSVTLHPRKDVDEFLESKGLTYRQTSETLSKYSNSVISDMARQPASTRNEWLRKELNAERRRKQLNLMAKVFKIVGVIQDASYLTLDERGDLNGVVSGTEGRCKVTTIGAGGYNVQCYHMRVLVKEL